ncbi:MAG TPA: hypothetical protein VIP11_25045, partial [Gemmatimonadaceae bacterium]
SAAHARAHQRGAPVVRTAAAHAATVAMTNATRYSTLCACSHWLAASSAAPAATAHHAHRP